MSRYDKCLAEVKCSPQRRGGGHPRWWLVETGRQTVQWAAVESWAESTVLWGTLKTTWLLLELSGWWLKILFGLQLSTE